MWMLPLYMHVNQKSDYDTILYDFCGKALNPTNVDVYCIVYVLNRLVLNVPYHCMCLSLSLATTLNKIISHNSKAQNYFDMFESCSEHNSSMVLIRGLFKVI